MTFSFRHPAGYGAISGGSLYAACGTYDELYGPAHRVKGLVQQLGANTPGMPPSGAADGICNAGNWYFGSGLLGSGLVANNQYELVVWEIHPSLPGTPSHRCQFTACDLAPGECYPDCSVLEPEEEEPVISGYAPLYYRAILAPQVARLLITVGVRDYSPDKNAILLTYDEACSNFGRSVWLSAPKQETRWRLEVTRGGCSHKALLVRSKIHKNMIESLERFQSSCFDIVRGGPLSLLTADGMRIEGAFTLRPGRNEEEARDLAEIPLLPSISTMQLPKSPSRTRRRRNGD
jgi:hypothetical protein